MRKLFVLIVVLVFVSCQQKEFKFIFTPYNETQEIAEQQQHNLKRMQFKLIRSKNVDYNSVFKVAQHAVSSFTEKDYNSLKPLILERNIPEIQQAVKDKKLTYEKITLFYLYRILKFESNHNLSLQAIIALNPIAVEEAREKDRNRPNNLENTLYGLPILLKDNINTQGMPTTAGAYVLKDNITPSNAFIVDKLKENGVIILGKANLSEWAYYFCSGCPLGYSAIGGQTLNPYGRKLFETGGSSSGSGVAVALNYAVAAVGTETAGSILSPSSLNSVVGLKPTVGLLSRTGIIPISSTLDTPGPITKSVIDNAIVLNALKGKDVEDSVTNSVVNYPDYITQLTNFNLKGKRLGVIQSLLHDSIYLNTVDKLRKGGAEIIEINPSEFSLNGFTTLLNMDMKIDLHKYLLQQVAKNITVSSIQDIVNFNLKDTIRRAPYGQKIFKNIIADTTSLAVLDTIKHFLYVNGVKFFKEPITTYSLDAVLSINNYHAAYAAVAKYPAITVPMGYKSTGEPVGLTVITSPFQEKKLLQIGYAFEKLTKIRKPPKGYN